MSIVSSAHLLNQQAAAVCLRGGSLEKRRGHTLTTGGKREKETVQQTEQTRKNGSMVF